MSCRGSNPGTEGLPPQEFCTPRAGGAGGSPGGARVEFGPGKSLGGNCCEGSASSGASQYSGSRASICLRSSGVSRRWEGGVGSRAFLGFRAEFPASDPPERLSWFGGKRGMGSGVARGVV